MRYAPIKTNVLTRRNFYWDEGLMEIERDAYLKKPISRKHDGFNELKIRGYSVDVGLVTCTEKNSNGSAARKQLEVDFV